MSVLASLGGLLASSPDDFAGSGAYERFDDDGDHRPYSMTNLGLHIRLRLVPRPQHSSEFLALLDCRREGDSESPRLAVYVTRLEGNTYVRTKRNTLLDSREGWPSLRVPSLSVEGSTLQELYFKEMDVPLDVGFRIPLRHLYHFPGAEHGITLIERYQTPCSLYAVWGRSDFFYLSDIWRVNWQASGLLFRHNRSNTMFAVMAVSNQDRDSLQLNVVIDCKGPALANLVLSCSNKDGEPAPVESSCDRTSKFLTDDTIVAVEARRRGNGKESRDVINVRIVDVKGMGVNAAILPGLITQHKFTASFEKAGLSLLGTYPEHFRDDDQMLVNDIVIRLTMDITRSILLFRHQEIGQDFVFAIVLEAVWSNDRQQIELWSDILTRWNFNFVLSGHEHSAKDIRDRYDKEHRRPKSASSSQLLRENKYVSVATTSQPDARSRARHCIISVQENVLTGS